VSYVGVSSGVPLIRHYFDHYYRLGVDRFLIVLHTPEGDERTPEVMQILAQYGIEPVEITTEFSTPRKLVRFNAIIDEHCDDDDWILYADTDELHIYPCGIHELVAECITKGYEFVRGRLVDRVADGGKLLPIPEDSSIWEQFQCVANMTGDVRFGWDGKVCLARSTRRLGEGGMHSLRYGSTDRQVDYDRTQFDTCGYPDPIEVGHFRWDATVVPRLRDKFEGKGGDREAVEDPTFMAEYQRIWDHISEHDCINAPGLRHVGVPEIHYER
jgi:hypothetical protein